MRAKRYVVDLTDDERARLEGMLRKGRDSARRLMRARVLLSADEDKLDQETAAAVRCSVDTVERVRRRFVEAGVEGALSDRPRPGGIPKLDGAQEAHLVALACSAPPDGRNRWTMRLLADRLVATGLVAAISDETVRCVLKKRLSSRGWSRAGASRS